MPAPPTYHVARWMFLRLLGVVYVAAFASLAVQVDGLVGSHGILPAREFFQVVASRLGHERFILLPTLCWVNASDAFLHVLCWGGVALGLLLLFDVAPLVMLALAWVDYLSLTVAGQDFLAFQWDALLLETGFLALLVAPWHLRPRFSSATPYGRGGLMLLWWLLFKLMVSSGAVKLLSGDPTWRHLTALQFHYETQPLPTWIGWWAHQLPVGFQKLSVMVMFGVELVVPWLIPLPGRLRRFAFAPLVGLQVLIALTGNYTFFNLLTVSLCVLLLDDAAWPARVRRGLQVDPVPAPIEVRLGPFRSRMRLIARGGLACLWVLSSLQMSRGLGWRRDWPAPVPQILEWARSLHIASNYGLFAVMTTTRPEIRVEGSDDGLNWQAYAFHDKPGDPLGRPRCVAPYQPRLDWQMWFAALGRFESEPWFGRFCGRLLLGSPEVTGLLATNPFPEHPPRYLRAELDRYHFTDRATRRATGAWWRVEPQGEYAPVLSLRGAPAR